MFTLENPMPLASLNTLNYKYKLYKLTCRDTGLNYVGCTKDVSKRVRAHVRCAYLITSRQYETKLSEAIRQYGIDSFDIFVLDSDDDEDFAKSVLEKSYIEMYDGYTKGYNSTKGGFGTTGVKVKPSQRRASRLSAKTNFAETTWFTNGKKDKRLKKGQNRPHGYHKGRTFGVPKAA